MPWPVRNVRSRGTDRRLVRESSESEVSRLPLPEKPSRLRCSSYHPLSSWEDLMRAASPVFVLVVAIAAGCGSKYTVVPVRGTIQLDGKPLEGATILTQPIGPAENDAPGPGSYGHTDADGRFSLELQNEPTPGAVPGDCVITITESGHNPTESDKGAVKSSSDSRRYRTSTSIPKHSHGMTLNPS